MRPDEEGQRIKIVEVKICKRSGGKQACGEEKIHFLCDGILPFDGCAFKSEFFIIFDVLC